MKKRKLKRTTTSVTTQRDQVISGVRNTDLFILLWVRQAICDSFSPGTHLYRVFELVRSVCFKPRAKIWGSTYVTTFSTKNWTNCNEIFCQICVIYLQNETNVCVIALAQHFCIKHDANVRTFILWIHQFLHHGFTSLNVRHNLTSHLVTRW